ncbi:cilium assembly protein DZIP1L-like isoform X2 [Watersipora subatra]|uniref:cilium assembly protein DZIP1L-like isoform X2 n=1 Tax=Watersipora subatra TaxID=2589382 RepID=UPI00355C0CE6
MEEALLAKPFAFKRRFERVDWRKLASVNLEQIARDLDFNALQENLTNIAFCNIEMELDLRLIDPNFVKLFRLGQLTIEYLLYSQEYLSETIVTLEGRVKNQLKNEENLMEKLRVLEKNLERMKKEGHKRKRLLIDQQHLIESGAENFHKCLLCPKAFMNATFLQNHCLRRHGQSFQEIKIAQDGEKENEIPSKISEQLEEIKDRLIFTESQLAEERKSLKEIGSRETSLLAERDAEHVKRLEEWQAMRETEHKQEIDRIQNMLMTELREMQEKQSATQRALEAAQQGLMVGARPSNLGSSIRDDIDVERELLAREREQLMNLKEEIKLQKDDMQERVEQEVRVRESKMRQDHSKEKQKFQQVLQEKVEEISSLQKQKSKQELKISSRMKKQPPARPVSPDLSSKQRTSTPISNSPIANGHTSPLESSQKTKKTLTFADETNLSSELQVPGANGDTISIESDEETTLATATNQSMSPQGTLDLTGNSKQLRDVMLENPQLLKDMKVQLQQKFNDELMRWDVLPDSEGMSSSKLTIKQNHLAQERSKLERKYKTFKETRDALTKEVDSLAKRKAAASSHPSTVSKGGYSPKSGLKLTGTLSSLTGTMESSTWGTTSSKWSSSDRREQVPDLSTDESSESDEESTTPNKSSALTAKDLSARAVNRAPPAVQPRDLSQSDQTRVSSGWTTVEHDGDGGFTPQTGARKQAIQMPVADAEDSDWDEDELSEVAEIGEGSKTPQLRSGTKAGGMIRNIAASIESQLLGRKGKAPVGGINTLELPADNRNTTGSPSTPEIPKIEQSDDDFSISSVEAQLMPTGSNTYSSRQWGQGSAANTLQSTAKQGRGPERANSITSDNASLTSVTGTAQRGDSGTDWSADSDLENL